MLDTTGDNGAEPTEAPEIRSSDFVSEWRTQPDNPDWRDRPEPVEWMETPLWRGARGRSGLPWQRPSFDTGLTLIEVLIVVAFVFVLLMIPLVVLLLSSGIVRLG